MSRWSFPLDERPRLVHCARAVHGRVPVERYRLRNLWCLHAYDYSAEVVIDGRVFALHPGAVTVVPPGVALEYRFRGESPHYFAHFRPRPEREGGRRTQLPVWLPADAETAWVARELREVARWEEADRLPAEVVLWRCLWKLAERARAQVRPGSAAAHPALVEARRRIEETLGDGGRVADVAGAVGLSPAHLTRLCRRELGVTLEAYIRARRLERARHLLLNTTMPIKAVAAVVGVPDLHQFNKLVRTHLGAAPRRLRAAPAGGGGVEPGGGAT